MADSKSEGVVIAAAVPVGSHAVAGGGSSQHETVAES